ncbi:MAG: hypothetical protein ACI4D9_10105 [Lachnospiraceae bacterium]
MVNDIVQAAEKSREVLRKIRDMSRADIDKKTLLPLVRQAVFYKLMIEEQAENNLRNLVIISIKTQDMKAGGLSDEMIRKQIQKYDCHQTSLVARKKVLLLMYLERELGIRMSDEDAVSAETLEDLSELIAFYLKEGV